MVPNLKSWEIFSCISVSSRVVVCFSLHGYLRYEIYIATIKKRLVIIRRGISSV